MVILQLMRALEGPGTRTTEHSGGWSSRQGRFGNQWRSVFRDFNNQDCCVGMGRWGGDWMAGFWDAMAQAVGTWSLGLVLPGLYFS